MKMYFYEVPPIDDNWEAMRLIDELPNAINCCCGKCGLPAWVKLEFDACLLASSKFSWGCWTDKEYSQPPRVFVLPDEEEFKIGFVWKTVNNGTTYIISPFELPWMVTPDWTGTEVVEIKF